MSTIESTSALGSTPDHTYSGQAEPRGFFFSADPLRHLSATTTAVMVDAAFFLKRAFRIFGYLSPQQTANRLHGMALDHLNDHQKGIDFILDPMWAPIRPQLFEHIDGLRSVCPRAAQQEKKSSEP